MLGPVRPTPCNRDVGGKSSRTTTDLARIDRPRVEESSQPRDHSTARSGLQLGLCELLAGTSILLFQPATGCAQAATLSAPILEHNHIHEMLSSAPLRNQQMLLAPAVSHASTNVDGALMEEIGVSSSGIPATGSTAASLLPIPTEFPPLPDVVLPEYKKITLDNGLRVFLIEDHEVPLVKGTMIIKGGQYASPKDKGYEFTLSKVLSKVGLASVTASVQRAGGSQQHPEAELNDRLEDLDAGVEAGAAAYAMNISFDCLAEDTDEVMGLFAEVVRTPALPERKLETVKEKLLNVLDHAYDDPGQTGRRMLQQLMWGKDSIYARQATKSQIRSMTVDDLRMYVSQYERPDMAVFGIVGDFESSQVEKRVEQLFGDWKAPDTPKFQKQGYSFPPQDAIENKVFLIDRPGLAQATVLTAEPGVELRDPDAAVLDVMGQIYGSFGGQLFNQIRSREGLAYSISGAWDTPPEHDGMFITASATSSPSELLVGLRKVLEQGRNEVVPAEDLTRARSKSLNSFIFNFVSSASQLSRIIAYELLEIPQDFPFQYKNAIESVDQQHVLEAAQRHLHPDKQTTVVVADARKARPAFEAAGFDVVPLTLPSLE